MKRLNLSPAPLLSPMSEKDEIIKKAVVVGNCMDPRIKEDYLLQYRWVDTSKIRTGDVVIFGSDRYSCSRVIGKIKAKGGITFYLKGDNAIFPVRVSDSDIIGQVMDVYDQAHSLVVKHFWHQKGLTSYILAYVMCFVYAKLYALKCFFYGTKPTRITSFLSRLQWNIYDTILKLIKRRDLNRQKRTIK